MVLGLSNGSGMFDVSGTAWMVFCFVRVKSFMLMWFGPMESDFVMMF
jgi:hypothetical protein